MIDAFGIVCLVEQHGHAVDYPFAEPLGKLQKCTLGRHIYQIHRRVAQLYELPAHGGDTFGLVHAHARGVDYDVVRDIFHLFKAGDAELRRHVFRRLHVAVVNVNIGAAVLHLFCGAPSRAARAEQQHLCARDLHAAVSEHERVTLAVGVVSPAGGRYYGVDRAKGMRVAFEPRKKGDYFELEGYGDVEAVVTAEELLRPPRKFFGRDGDIVVGYVFAHSRRYESVHGGTGRAGDVLAYHRKFESVHLPASLKKSLSAAHSAIRAAYSSCGSRSSRTLPSDAGTTMAISPLRTFFLS